MKLTRIFLFIAASVFLPHPSHAASFDCAKVQTSVEKNICADPDLSAADTALMNSYKKALSASSNSESLKAEQRQWMKTRDACADLACLKKAYQERISALDKLASTSATTPAEATSSAPIPEALAKILVGRMLHEKFYQDWVDGDQLKKELGDNAGHLSSLFSAESADLNHDGQAEWLIGQNEEHGFCGSQNCPVWVYQKVGNSYRSLLDATAGYIGGESVLKTSTGGWQNLQTEEHSSAVEHEFTTYHFDGKVYRPSLCVTEIAEESGKVSRKRHPCTGNPQ